MCFTPFAKPGTWKNNTILVLHIIKLSETWYGLIAGMVCILLAITVHHTQPVWYDNSLAVLDP
jgi:hypothetical protein